MTPRLRLAQASRSMRPLQHGQLDSLSGLYAIINIVRVVAHPQRLSLRSCRRLFDAGLLSLHRSGQLLRSVGHGIDEAAWLTMCDAVLDQAGQLARAQLALDRVPPDIQLRSTLRFVRASIRSGFPVLIRLGTSPPHWTVITRTTATRFYLFDSAGRQWLAVRQRGSQVDHYQVRAEFVVIASVRRIAARQHRSSMTNPPSGSGAASFDGDGQLHPFGPPALEADHG